MFMVITTANIIVGILITISGIALLRYFAQRKAENNSYKPAVFIYIIWSIIFYFGLTYLYGYISSSYILLESPLRSGFMTLHAIVTIIIELIIISILIKYFYKARFEDSIFMAIQVMSVQILMRIIATNILAIIFNLTTGGFIFFYFFQY